MADISSVTRRKVKIRRAPKYCNIFYNNDVTSFDIVIALLTKIFNKSLADGMLIANAIHKQGKGIVLISSKEVCETKEDLVSQAKEALGPMARELKTTVEVYDEQED